MKNAAVTTKHATYELQHDLFANFNEKHFVGRVGFSNKK